jgi:Zn-dependent protease with chaperone function
MMINAREYMHPDDKAALSNLESVALFPQCVKAFLKLMPERLQRGLNMAGKIRLSPTQLPDIYRKLPPICAALGIAEPELYLGMDHEPNAYAFGDSAVSVSITSGLVECMDERELTAVLAHECGHIACRHVLFHSMARSLLSIGSSIFGPLAAVSYPVQLALFAWSRKSELSADRAAALVCGGADAVVDTMIRLSGGPASITAEVDRKEYLEQAAAYEKLLDESFWNLLLQANALKESSHPLCAVRAREIDAWCRGSAFAAIMGSGLLEAPDVLCPSCGKAARAEWKYCRACGAPLAGGHGGEADAEHD